MERFEIKRRAGDYAIFDNESRLYYSMIEDGFNCRYVKSEHLITCLSQAERILKILKERDDGTTGDRLDF